MNRILLISSPDNDLARLILRTAKDTVLVSPDAKSLPNEPFDAVCILGGDGDEALRLTAPVRLKIDALRTEGKPIFFEFVASVGQCYADAPKEMTHHRMVYESDHFSAKALRDGEVLDGHFNGCLAYHFVPKDAKMVLRYYDYVSAHDHVHLTDEQRKTGLPALWFHDKTTLVCGFRLCNFRRARLASRASFEALIRSIVQFLLGEDTKIHFEAPVCSYQKEIVKNAADTDAAVKRGLAWFHSAEMLRDGGEMGVYEGFSHHVKAQNGKQLRAEMIRTDCTAEVGGAFLLNYMVTGNTDSLALFRRTDDFCFDWMQIKEGPHRGMLRWTESAWEVCYQDDVARAILPTLLYQNFGGGAPHFDQAVDALEYMIKTTGEDGLRAFRTDIYKLTDAECERLKKAGVGVASAHYNAYYHAALLLAHRAGAPAHFLEVAKKGLSSIMGRYPITRRETSETEEYCRLIFPLAALYEATGDPLHYEWLCRVTEDLVRFRHPSGGYAEWDTDYRAACARNDKGECALLANNGDPVCDLLYSNNWLPLGFAYAYLVTGEKRFHELWAGIASFLLSCQIHSEDKNLDGAWARAFDMDRWEIYGVPHDVGWAPCCIETGWTMGEILMGLQFMHIAEQIQANE